MENQIPSILRLAGTILSNPEARCTGTLAEDLKGTPVPPTSDKACRWCLTGAMQKAIKALLPTANTQETYAVYQEMKSCIGLDQKLSGPVYWDSNEHKHDAIVSKLRKAK